MAAIKQYLARNQQLFADLLDAIVHQDSTTVEQCLQKKVSVNQKKKQHHKGFTP